MDKLEEYIMDNREEFDMAELPEGHFERFKQKLDAQSSKKRTPVMYIRYASAAAVIAVMLTLSVLYVNDNWISPRQDKLPSLADVSPEFAEAEAYFVSTINHQEQTIDELGQEGLEVEKQMFMKEVQDMDSVYTKLQKELKANPNDERVVNAMIKHYQMRIKVMTRIVNQLKQVKQIKNQKTQNHDNVHV